MDITLLPGVDTLRSLHLSTDTFFIYGSGPLVVRGLRSTQDLDVYVMPEVFDKLRMIDCFTLGKTSFGNRSLTWEQLDITDTFPNHTPEYSRQFLAFTEMIEGLPFLCLDQLIYLKNIFNRPKDRRDIQLIEEYRAGGGI